MIDKDPGNDEYKLDESEFQDSNPLEAPPTGEDTSSQYGASLYKPTVRRNALIVIGLIILALIVYWFFSSPSKPKLAPQPSPPVAEVVPEPVAPTPVPTPAPVPAPVEADSELKQRVASIESNQQNVSSQVSSVSQQLGTVNTNVSNLNDEINKLNQVISSLSSQVEKQSEELRIITLRCRPRPVKLVIPESERIVYFIKAIIPGRAWLIGSNGSTLSVREGINLNGYGVVKLIDSVQGRVITSSGKIIRFSQDDS